MNGDYWIVNSKDTLGNVCDHIQSRWSDEKYLRVQVKGGKARTLPQNDLYQVWSREFADFIHKRKATELEHEAMKIALQRRCYAQTGRDYLITHITDPLTGKEKPERQSTGRLGSGEMFEYMEWVQSFAACEGLTLESRGEYADNQQRAVA